MPNPFLAPSESESAETPVEQNVVPEDLSCGDSDVRPRRGVHAQGLPMLWPSFASPDWPALFHAVSRGNLGLARTLLLEGADVNDRDAHGLTALMLAVTTVDERRDIVAVLLRAGANPVTARSTGIGPLHLAAAAGRTAIIELLLENGARAVCGNPHGAQPLAMARTGAAMRLLLQAGADVRANRGEAMLRACGYADPDCLMALIEAGGDIDAHALGCPENTTFREVACRRLDLAQVIARHEGMALSHQLSPAREARPARCSRL